MLGVKTCRAARTCCAGRALVLSASQSVRVPGPARRYGMQGLARWLHAWRWRTWQCLVWPLTRGGTLLWRHMHKVYYSLWASQSIPRLSHRLSYVTFRTISWSWNSSPTISWLPVRYASVYIIHMYPMCVAQSAARGTVEIRMTIGCAQLKRNLDLILKRIALSCTRAQLFAAQQN